MVESRLTRILLRARRARRSRSSTCRCSSSRCTRSTGTSRRLADREYSTKWFSVAFHDQDVRDAFMISLIAAVGATAIALVLGTLASLAVSRCRFFGREVITFAVILPIALPGSSPASRCTRRSSTSSAARIGFGLATIIIGHATFCIVVIYNNALARLRRTAGSLEEASADLGADNWQTFRHVMFPQMRDGAARRWAARVRALVRRGHRDGLHSRRDQTLPIWIFATLSRPDELPIVNVVALFVIVVSIIPCTSRRGSPGRAGSHPIVRSRARTSPPGCP